MIGIFFYIIWLIWNLMFVNWEKTVFYLLNSYSITPVLNIVQTFLNEDKLYNAIVDLPQTANFLGSITAVATHAKFKVLEGNDEFLLLSSNICRLYKFVYAFYVIDLADIVLNCARYYHFL